MNSLKKTDLELHNVLRLEIEKQRDNLNLIASENYVSKAVLEAVGSIFTNKYAEGYPGRRCYGGCQYIDRLEEIACRRACRLYRAEHANVQPHAGSQANMAVYFSVLKPGDKVLAMNLRAGGHLTHGNPANFSGLLYQVVFYNVDPETNRLNYQRIAEIAAREKPKIITCGASSYPRTIDFAEFGKIAQSVSACLMADIAHLAGLVAAGVHPSPVPHAEFVTSTTHKTLRGPRGGFILCRKAHQEKIDRAIFPGIQGGPLMHEIAGKAVAFKQAATKSFRLYQQQIVRNSRKLCAELMQRNYRAVSGGTDNHLMLFDLQDRHLTGLEAEKILGQAGIIVNHNTIPFDPLPPSTASGIRLGTPAVTSRGMKEKEMILIAEWIDAALKNRGKDKVLKEIAAKVRRFCRAFPIYPEG